MEVFYESAIILRKWILNNWLWRLKVEKERSITEIGETYGYSSSNFATAFKKHLDISPADYRRSSEQMVEDSSFSHGMTLDNLDDAGSKITVEYLAPFTVLYERKKGNYHNLSDEWCDFIEKYRYLATKDTLYIDCTIDDPSITDEDGCLRQEMSWMSDRLLIFIGR